MGSDVKRTLMLRELFFEVQLFIGRLTGHIPSNLAMLVGAAALMLVLAGACVVAFRKPRA